MMKNRKYLFLCAILLVLAFLSVSCSDKTNDDPSESGSDTADTANGDSVSNGDGIGEENKDTPFRADELTIREIFFIEDILDKDLADITKADVDGVNKLNIVGEQATFDNYTADTDYDEYYYFNGEKFSIGEDSYGDVLSVLRYFKNITELNIYFCFGIEDISFVSELSKLEVFKVILTDISDFSSLGEAHSLKELAVHHTPIEKLELSKNAPLTRIVMKNTTLPSFSAFEDLQSLTMIYVEDNKVPIEDTVALSSLTKLYVLMLDAPEMDLSFIGSMNSSLGVLSLDGTDEMDLSGVVRHAETLEEFVLRNSRNTDLTPLDGLPDRCIIMTVNSPTDKRGTRTAESGKNRYEDIVEE